MAYYSYFAMDNRREPFMMWNEKPLSDTFFFYIWLWPLPSHQDSRFRASHRWHDQLLRRLGPDLKVLQNPWLNGP